MAAAHPPLNVFFALQTLIALILLAMGSSAAWDDAAAWWPLIVIMTNVACLVILTNFTAKTDNAFGQFLGSIVIISNLIYYSCLDS